MAAPTVASVQAPQPVPGASVKLIASIVEETASKITHSIALESAPPATDKTPQAQSPNAQSTSSTSTIPVAVPDIVEIVHSNGTDGHVSVINNTLNNVSIRQSVELNLSVENFHQVHGISAVQRSMAAISRHIGVLSLRH